jgi:hypothetical protein
MSVDFSYSNVDMDELILNFNNFEMDCGGYDTDFFDEKDSDLDEVLYGFSRYEFYERGFLSNNNVEAIREKISCLFTKRFKNKFL